MNFGGIDAEYSAFEKAVFAVVPVPYDLTSTYQSGSRRGPGAILEASCNMELYDEELEQESFLTGIHTLPPLEVEAGGPEAMTDAVHRVIAGLLKAGKIPVLLGGEHSLSVGAVRAMKEAYPDISVLHLDAHADMRDTYQGTPYSHACAGRRMSECCPLVQIGIRSMSAEEAEFIKKRPVKTYSADFISGNDAWKDHIREELRGDLYISLDLDVLDPSVMPSTGTPEPGGLQWKELLDLLREVTGRGNVRGFDVVELSPIPGLVAPDFLAAKLVYKMIGYITAGREGRSGKRS
jgi:agmatinase